MYPHHAQAIDNVTDHFKRDPMVQALILCGSIAHGFESETSDIDILIVLSEEDYQHHVRSGELTFYSNDKSLCDYPGGYVDGKFISVNFILEVAHRGSEPARFAFEGARILFDRIGPNEVATGAKGGSGGVALAEAIAFAVAYPGNGKTARLARFLAQYEAWRWFAREALAKGDRYLLGVAVQKMVLFGGRLILAHNEMLYPFHKWFIRMLENAPDKPAELVPSLKLVVKGFRSWEVQGASWPMQFMLDTELTWMDGKVPLEDI